MPRSARGLFDVAVRQPEPEVPAHSQHDDLRWEPEPGERGPRREGGTSTADATHARACRALPSPMQQPPGGYMDRRLRPLPPCRTRALAERVPVFVEVGE